MRGLGRIQGRALIRELRGGQRGFTLVELITVLVVLALIATIGAGFIVSASDSYRQSQSRALLQNTARQSLERMTRQLRGALPYSVRVTNGGQCVEFMAVAGGGYYRQAVPDRANGAAAQGVVETAPHTVDFGVAEYISIGAMSSDELYGGAPVSLRPLSSRTNTQVQFPSHTWQRNSVSQRFFLLNAPDAFCLFGGELRFYPDQNITAAGIDPAAGYSLLARRVQADGTPFVLSTASHQLNVVLTMRLRFTEGSESLVFEQEVALRNVP